MQLESKKEQGLQVDVKVISTERASKSSRQTGPGGVREVRPGDAQGVPVKR